VHFAVNRRMALVFSILLPTAVFAQEQDRRGGSINVVALDGSGKPIGAVRVQLKRDGAFVGDYETNDAGRAEFKGLALGSYGILLSKEGFQNAARDSVCLADGSALEVEFVLVSRLDRKDGIDVRAQAGPLDQAASPSARLQSNEVKQLPSRPATVADTLPLVPGIARSPDGEIKIEGSGEHRSALLVNSADVTDPATGRFGMTVPVDSAEVINVFKTPFLAEYGRFTAGVVSVETRRGGEKWHFELNDPLPDFRIRSWRLRGLRDASPRLSLNGPLIANRLYFSEGLEYDIQKRPVRTLPFPFNESKQESVNSFTQLDYVISSTHLLTGTFHFAPRHTNFVNPQYFDPQPVTPGFRAQDYAATFIDHLAVGRGTLESGLGVQHFDDAVAGQGNAEMVLTPTGNRGNYFGMQDRDAGRVEWLEIYSPGHFTGFGAHDPKLGLTVARTSNRGQFSARPVNIQDTAGRLLERIQFAGGRPFDRTDLETAFFSQDHWAVRPGLVLDLGTRLERQSIAGSFRIAPRVGMAWTPLNDQRTVIRGGAGMFYDRVPLSVYSFESYPQQVITSYGPNGQATGGPVRFANIIGTVPEWESPFIYGGSGAGGFAPHSTTWNVEIERSVGRWLRVRANYLHSDSAGVVVVRRQSVPGKEAMILTGDGRSRYRQLEITARFAWRDGQEMMFSYVRSRARGDLNEFNQYLGNFPLPVVRPNLFSNLPGDLPNRLLAWGIVRLPWKLQIAPAVEYRTGFPYALLDARQNYAAMPNTGKLRFPGFFSLDARISKEFKVSSTYTLRFSVSGFNLINHFNALDVHANVADPQAGIFFGNYKRMFRPDFDVIF